MGDILEWLAAAWLIVQFIPYAAILVAALVVLVIVIREEKRRKRHEQ